MVSYALARPKLSGLHFPTDSAGNTPVFTSYREAVEYRNELNRESLRFKFPPTPYDVVQVIYLDEEERQLLSPITTDGILDGMDKVWDETLGEMK